MPATSAVLFIFTSGTIGPQEIQGGGPPPPPLHGPHIPPVAHGQGTLPPSQPANTHVDSPMVVVDRTVAPSEVLVGPRVMGPVVVVFVGDLHGAARVVKTVIRLVILASMVCCRIVEVSVITLGCALVVVVTVLVTRQSLVRTVGRSVTVLVSCVVAGMTIWQTVC